MRSGQFTARSAERVGENLNEALAYVLGQDDRVTLMGQDLLDPYGGAFKVSRGLSTKYPESVITTPISESGVLGVAAGLALCGDKPIVEVMFGDFIALGFDMLLNFATKSVAMYGRHVPMNLVVRCPVGGNRGYGATHSQSMQKFLLGMPYLSLFEVSQFHDNASVMQSLINHGQPCVLFEDKSLYAQPMYATEGQAAGKVDDVFSFDFLDQERQFARIRPDGSAAADAVIITGGGTFGRALTAAGELLVEAELDCHIIVASQLYPIDITPLLPVLVRADRICVIEEGTADGGWASYLAGLIHGALWDKVRHRVMEISSSPTVIPAAAHLERHVLVQPESIRDVLLEAARG